MITPPDLYSVPRYNLTNKFIGRSHELSLLDTWAAAPEPIMILEAIGGMGKSALTWEWINQDARRDDFAGRVWISFYERGTKMGNFLRYALGYVTGQDPDKLKNLPDNVVADQLRIILDKERYLLVLDGLERILVAYHRIDASQVRDDEVQAHLRDTIDPKDARLLRQLAGAKQAKILITSRLMPHALEEYGDTMSGVSHHKLTGLQPEDAYHLMLDRGVQPPQNRTQIDTFMKRFGYHSLLLRIVAGRIKNHRRARGDFDMWYELDGKHLHDDELEKHRLKILQYSLEGLSPTVQRLLSQISAFSDSVDYATISVFNPYLPEPPTPIDPPDVATLEDLKRRRDAGEQVVWDKQIRHLELDVERYEDYLQRCKIYEASAPYLSALSQFDNDLTELEDRGLLMWDRQSDAYDIHPVVRGYSFDRLEDDERIAAYDSIFNHFENQAQDNYKNAQSIEDLQKSLEMYRALIGSERHLQAADLFDSGFGRALRVNLGAYLTIIEFLKPFFPFGFKNLPASIIKNRQQHIAIEAAIALSNVGRIEESESLLIQLISHDIIAKDGVNLLARLISYGVSLERLNKLYGAYTTYELGLRLADYVHNKSLIHEVRSKYVHICTILGYWDKAYEQLALIDMDASNGGTEIRVAQMRFFQGEEIDSLLNQAFDKARKHKAIAWVRAAHELTTRQAIINQQWSTALHHIEEAIKITQRTASAELADYQAMHGLIIAKSNGDMTRALDLIETSLETNLFPKNFAHIYHCAAEVHHVQGDAEQSTKYAELAYAFAWADGDPYVRRYELQQAAALCKKLKVQLPEVHPFDASDVRPSPFVKDIEDLLRELKVES